jgi:hypothetical protein
MAATGENPRTETKGAAAAPAGASAGVMQYEFQEPENRLIKSLASKMHFVGLFGISIGLLTIALGAIMFHVAPILTGTYSALLGIWTQRASISFRSIVDTQGKDVSHLIAALEDLRKLYSLQFWLCVLTLVIATASLLLVMLSGWPKYL